MVVNKSATQELVRERTGRDPIELVRELYVDRRHSDQEIADALGVNRVTVSRWRRDNGISRALRAKAVTA
jgi:DNA invertase Pin-like site-specific DNA recombinase